MLKLVEFRVPCEACDGDVRAVTIEMASAPAVGEVVRIAASPEGSLGSFRVTEREWSVGERDAYGDGGEAYASVTVSVKALS